MPQKLTPHLIVGQNDRPPKLGGLIEAGGGKFSGAGRRRLLELVHAGKESCLRCTAPPHMISDLCPRGAIEATSSGARRSIARRG
jgi:hypothetical protein